MLRDRLAIAVVATLTRAWTGRGNHGLTPLSLPRLLDRVVRDVKEFCPGGTTDNSPAIYRWVRRPIIVPFSPVGTAEVSTPRFSRPYGTNDEKLISQH